MDWHQLWTIASAPDNIPIVAMLFLAPFFTWLGIKQARANDRLVEKLEEDPQLAKTHHRKVEPWRPGWAREIHVWPYLVRIEFLVTVIVTVILFVWSITLNAPLEEPANPNLTMNPSKAPWYFLGLQEMLVYFDPWIEIDQHLLKTEEKPGRLRRIHSQVRICRFFQRGIESYRPNEEDHGDDDGNEKFDANQIRPHMYLSGPAGAPWFNFSVMSLRELRIFFQFLNEPVIGPRLLDSEPRKEGRKKKHGYNRNVVRS